MISLSSLKTKPLANTGMSEDHFAGLHHEGIKPVLLPPLFLGLATSWCPARGADRASTGLRNAATQGYPQVGRGCATAYWFWSAIAIFDLVCFSSKEESLFWCFGSETSCLLEWAETQNMLHKNSGNFQITLISGTTWLPNVCSHRKKINANSFWMKNDWREKYKSVFIS